MLLSLNFAQKENLEIQAVFKGKIIHILLGEAKILFLPLVYFRFGNRQKAVLSVHCLLLFNSVQEKIQC